MFLDLCNCNIIYLICGFNFVLGFSLVSRFKPRFTWIFFNVFVVKLNYIAVVILRKIVDLGLYNVVDIGILDLGAKGPKEIMASGFGESTSRPSQNPSFSSNNNNNSDAGNFECNICLDLAQDPIVTLCGHLFCWPCLYKWLHGHSQAQECPVCKALIQEEKLVPLYGRGKTSTDPRSKSIPGVDIPNRPAGQRPETAPPPEPNHFAHHGHGFGLTGGLGGFAPMASARFGNFTFSAAFGGLIPSLFNLQLHGFPDATMYGTPAGFPYGFSNSFHGGHVHGFRQRTGQRHQDNNLKRLLLLIAFCVLLALLWQ